MAQDVCEIYSFDEPKVHRLQSLLKNTNTEYMVKVFKALADDTRSKIAYALCMEGELCVCDVANVIGTTIANASHHLRLLKNMGIAKYRKDGKLVFYSLDDDHVKQLILLALEHGEEKKEYAEHRPG